MTSNPPILTIADTLAVPVKPADFPQTVLRFRNDRAAAEVGLDGLSDENWTRHLGRFDPLPDNLPEPLALAYHGHQFRSYNPEIGDGRGFLFAQLRDRRGRLMDLGTKGSGQTPFSRTGDGRLTLKGGVREVLATELLEALGVPTSRSLSLIETGESLVRGDEPSPTRSSVLVRLSHSHIRFGSFQRLMAMDDEEGMQALLSYSCEHLVTEAGAEDPPGFLLAVTKRMAVQVAGMMAAGFVHGVLNTDNMNVTGECFDYGPWRFLTTLDPQFTAAYFDHTGLYAFGRQPEAFYWNLAALAHALSLIGEEKALQEALATFPDHYADAFAAAVLRRLGIEEREPQEDHKLASDLFIFLHRTGLPFERAFFDLFGGRAGADKRSRSPHAELYGAEDVVVRIDERSPLRPERLTHPVFADEPQTLLLEEVESIWDAIAERDDWKPFENKIAAIRRYGEALSPEAA
ncbi:protein adenylyltransferase SelO family protein [Parvularcula maris]|uniref:protein adenylyltransferase SelO family protein n=1 Tax=Parvularcula maris TaxID=2965077 RepID=UPI003F7F154B